MKYQEDEIIKLIKEGIFKAKDLTDNGICPTCFDREHNNILYGNIKDVLLYEDSDVIGFLDKHLKSRGHVIILSKIHYKDMLEIPDDLCRRVFITAKKLMQVVKEVYECESVYLCTMCDGPMNHFHLQLIPRYKEEKRGSVNFVKERKNYVHEEEKIESIRKLMNIK